MGFDCVYQGIPANSKIIELAEKDAKFAEEILYPAIRFGQQFENSGFSKEPEFDLVRKLFKEYPNLGICNYSPVSRKQNALIYVLEPNSYLTAENFAALEETFPYKFVKGERVFRKDFRSPQGALVRVSSPEFVRKCVEFCEQYPARKGRGLRSLRQNMDLTLLARNFDSTEMTENNIYKVSELTNFKSIEDYFVDLSDFYHKIAHYRELSVFVTED